MIVDLIPTVTTPDVAYRFITELCEPVKTPTTEKAVVAVSTSQSAAIIHETDLIVDTQINQDSAIFQPFQSISPAQHLSFGGGQAAAFLNDDKAEVGAYFAQSHTENVTNPEIQPVVKVMGRKPGTAALPASTLPPKRNRTYAVRVKGTYSGVPGLQDLIGMGFQTF